MGETSDIFRKAKMYDELVAYINYEMGIVKEYRGMFRQQKTSYKDLTERSWDAKFEIIERIQRYIEEQQEG